MTRRHATAKADAPEFPKPLVRLKPEAGGYGCEVRMVGDADAETAATDDGYVAVTLPASSAVQEFPKWQYHADGRRQIVYTQAEADALEGFEATPPTDPDAETTDVPAVVVASEAEALALGEGWSATPVADEAPAPVLTALVPDTATIGDPSFTLHVHGTGFLADAVIVFNGYDEPTTVVSSTEVTTGVNMLVWTGPSLPLPVTVRQGVVVSNALSFTFEAAPPFRSAADERPGSPRLARRTPVPPD